MDNIEFTREDSDRLVRLESQNVAQTLLLTNILAQCTKTNGRVDRLEDKIALLETRSDNMVQMINAGIETSKRVNILENNESQHQGIIKFLNNTWAFLTGLAVAAGTIWAAIKAH